MLSITSSTLLIYGVTIKKHDELLNAILKAIRDSDSKLNKAKCYFQSESEIQYFGHMISVEGLKPDPNKVKPLIEMPSPSNAEKLHQLLDLINYIGIFRPFDETASTN